MDKIHNYLMEINVPVSNRGFDYLHDAIKIMMEDNLRKNNIIGLYTSVGDLHEEHCSNVERCIRYSINKCFSNTDKGKLSEIFGEVNVKRGRIKNSEFIAISALYLK